MALLLLIGPSLASRQQSRAGRARNCASNPSRTSAESAAEESLALCQQRRAPGRLRLRLADTGHASPRRFVRAARAHTAAPTERIEPEQFRTLLPLRSRSLITRCCCTLFCWRSQGRWCKIYTALSYIDIHITSKLTAPDRRSVCGRLLPSLARLSF